MFANTFVCLLCKKETLKWNIEQRVVVCASMWLNVQIRNVHDEGCVPGSGSLVLKIGGRLASQTGGRNLGSH